MMRTRKRAIERGKRYRELRRSMFGRAAGAEWVVEAVDADALGVRHARLVSVADLTERKTLSAAVLSDPKRFEEV
jgi:hypothetical protein